MWSKKYLLNPTADEYFKTKHPIATTAVLLPPGIYCLYIKIADINNWLVLIGASGCLIFGVGLAYLFAVIKKVYTKAYVPFLALILGSIMITASLYFT